MQPIILPRFVLLTISGKTIAIFLNIKYSYISVANICHGNLIRFFWTIFVCDKYCLRSTAKNCRNIWQYLKNYGLESLQISRRNLYARLIALALFFFLCPVSTSRGSSGRQSPGPFWICAEGKLVANFECKTEIPSLVCQKCGYFQTFGSKGRHISLITVGHCRVM